MRIGENVTIKTNFETDLPGGKIIELNKGDKGFIDGGGNFHIQAGKNKGKICSTSLIMKDGYDHSNISVMIVENIQKNTPILDILKDYDIGPEYLKEEITDSLIEIL